MLNYLIPGVDVIKIEKLNFNAKKLLKVRCILGNGSVQKGLKTLIPQLLLAILAAWLKKNFFRLCVDGMAVRVQMANRT